MPTVTCTFLGTNFTEDRIKIEDTNSETKEYIQAPLCVTRKWHLNTKVSSSGIVRENTSIGTPIFGTCGGGGGAEDDIKTNTNQRTSEWCMRVHDCTRNSGHQTMGEQPAGRDLPHTKLIKKTKFCVDIFFFVRLYIVLSATEFWDCLFLCLNRRFIN
jgi:hypothetical protein